MKKLKQPPFVPDTFNSPKLRKYPDKRRISLELQVSAIVIKFDSCMYDT